MLRKSDAVWVVAIVAVGLLVGTLGMRTYKAAARQGPAQETHMARGVHAGATKQMVEVEGTETGHSQHVVLRKGAPGEWASKASGGNTTVTASKAGEAGKRHCITGVSVAYTNPVPAGTATAQIKSGDTVLWEVDLAAVQDGTANWNPALGDGILCVTGEAAAVVATTDNGNLKVNVAGYTRSE